MLLHGDLFGGGTKTLLPFSLCRVFIVPKIKEANFILCATNSSSQTSTSAPVAFLSDCFQTGLIDRPDSTSVLLSLHLHGCVPADRPHQPSWTDLLRGALAGSITGRVGVFIRCIHPFLTSSTCSPWEALRLISTFDYIDALVFHFPPSLSPPLNSFTFTNTLETCSVGQFPRPRLVLIALNGDQPLAV